MNGRVHYWIVCDAVQYIKNYGNDEQKRALQTLQLAYGTKESVDSISSGHTAVELLAGFESSHTDKFGDVAVKITGFPWGEKRNVTGLAWHSFSAFNHFIDPYPGTHAGWLCANGYSYKSSSKRGIDTMVVRSISDYLGAMLEDNSLVWDRIRSLWAKGSLEWTQNFEQEFEHSTFAPWCVLVMFYHSNLILNHYDPIEVRGPNSHIVGLQVFGPIFHAIADACSPQHVRPALGFGHQVWENCVQAMVYNRAIGTDPGLIHELMAGEPLGTRGVVREGPLKGRFDVAGLVYRLSVRTAERISRSAPAKTWTDLWYADENFWRSYLTSTAMGADAYYLYNQAVAATIHALVSICHDLIDVHLVEEGTGLKHPEKMPHLDMAGRRSPQAPMKKAHRDDVPSEETRPVPFSQARDILGFMPPEPTDLQEQLTNVRRLFISGSPSRSRVQELKILLDSVESSLVRIYKVMDTSFEGNFCPLRAMEKIPLDSDVSAHFGTGTFRLPSAEECAESSMLMNYIDQLEAHSLMAYKLQLTQAIASLNFFRGKFLERKGIVFETDRLLTDLLKGRDEAPLEAGQPTESVTWSVHEQVEALSQRFSNGFWKLSYGGE